MPSREGLPLVGGYPWHLRMLEAGSYRTSYDGDCRIWYGQGCAPYWMASKNKRTCPHIHDYWYVSVFPNRNIFIGIVLHHFYERSLFESLLSPSEKAIV